MGRTAAELELKHYEKEAKIWHKAGCGKISVDGTLKCPHCGNYISLAATKFEKELEDE